MPHYFCEDCRRAFDSPQPRCPTCLRLRSVRDLQAPPSPSREPSSEVPAGPSLRRPGALVLLSVLILLCAAAILGAASALSTDSAFEVRAHVATAFVTSVEARVASRTGGCDVRYRYSVAGRDFEGRDSFHVGCAARPFASVDVDYLPEAPARSRLHAGHGGDLVFTLGGIAITAVFLVLVAPVWAHLAFPRNEALRRLAARLGSKHARLERPPATGGARSRDRGATAASDG